MCHSVHFRINTPRVQKCIFLPRVQTNYTLNVNLSLLRVSPNITPLSFSVMIIFEIIVRIYILPESLSWFWYGNCYNGQGDIISRENLSSITQTFILYIIYYLNLKLSPLFFPLAKPWRPIMNKPWSLVALKP